MLYGRAGQESLPMSSALTLPGSFQLWRYSVSHSELLLCAPRGEAESSLRTDIMFAGVAALCLPNRLPDPTIRVADLRQIGGPTLRGDPYESVGFILEGQGWAGWVQANRLAWSRFKAEFFEPGPFDLNSSIQADIKYFP